MSLYNFYRSKEFTNLTKSRKELNYGWKYRKNAKPNRKN